MTDSIKDIVIAISIGASTVLMLGFLGGSLLASVLKNLPPRKDKSMDDILEQYLSKSPSTWNSSTTVKYRDPPIQYRRVVSRPASRAYRKPVKKVDWSL